jgi:hypothetical protein
MTEETLEGHLGVSVAIDVCQPCQVFWFDAHESLQLAPSAVLNLFRLIAERPNAARPPASGHPSCPRCGIRLLDTHDQQRHTRFEYLRCPREHGRLITFVNFLREKDFIRPLSPQEIDTLRQNVREINCSNCGAPIDVTKDSACTHCGSPLSMLDMNQAGKLVAALHEAEQRRPIDPTLPLQLEQARREVETAFAGVDRWLKDRSG